MNCKTKITGININPRKNYFSEYTVQFDKNSKIPIQLPPTNSPDGTYSEQPIFDYDLEKHPFAEARSKFDLATELLDEGEEVYPQPNVRRRRQNEEQGRLLSQSAFNRITETLGALNKVGSFFLNMTREVNGEHDYRGDMQLISSSSTINMSTKKPTTIEHTGVFSTDYSTTTEKSVSDSFIKISSNKSGQNITNTIDTLTKRIGQSQEKESKTDKQTLNEKLTVSSISEKIDMAALAEKKRKKHQAVASKKEILTAPTIVSTTISPGSIILYKKP